MAANDLPCKSCGARIQWAPGLTRPIESGWTGYTRHPADGECNDVLFTSEGGRIWCRILPPEMDDQVEGYAHKLHICPSKPVKRETTERERQREEYKAFRKEMREENENGQD